MDLNDNPNTSASFSVKSTENFSSSITYSTATPSSSVTPQTHPVLSSLDFSNTTSQFNFSNSELTMTSSASSSSVSYSSSSSSSITDASMASNSLPLSTTVTPTPVPSTSFNTSSVSTNNNPTQTNIASSRVVLDGSKMILRFEKGISTIIEKPIKLMASTNNLKVVYHSSRYVISCDTEKSGLAIIDASSNNHFIPIHLGLYGVVYTRGGSFHVIVGDVNYTKVSNRAFPYKICNKFVSSLDDELYKEINAIEQASYTSQDNTMSHTNTPTNLLKSDIMESLIGKYSHKLHTYQTGNTVYLRADDSITRIVLSGGETIFLHSGAVIAWTLGITFEYKRICCTRMVFTIQAKNSGVVWIHNPYRNRISR